MWWCRVEREDIRKPTSVIIVSATEIVIIDNWLGYNYEEYLQEWLWVDELSKEVEWLRDTEELGVISK
jgi:hypothetical protein